MNLTGIRKPANLSDVKNIINKAKNLSLYVLRGNIDLETTESIKDLVFGREASDLFNGKIIKRISFRNCLFDNINFGHSNFKSVEFEKCYFKYANFLCSVLKDTSFCSCEMNYSKFSGSKMDSVIFLNNEITCSNFEDLNAHRVKFMSTDLTDSSFKHSEFEDSGFINSILRSCCFSHSKFNNLKIGSTDLRGIDFSSSVGLLNPIDFLKENFEWENNCLIVYKVFGVNYDINPNWIIEEGSIISEEVNYDRTLDCACGISVGNIKLISIMSFSYGNKQVWKCRILPEWLPGVVVPYNSICQVRSSKIQLIEKIPYPRSL